MLAWLTNRGRFCSRSPYLRWATRVTMPYAAPQVRGRTSDRRAHVHPCSWGGSLRTLATPCRTCVAKCYPRLDISRFTTTGHRPDPIR
jgi:hypothetical protein